jgi:O-antigen ligase
LSKLMHSESRQMIFKPDVIGSRKQLVRRFRRIPFAVQASFLIYVFALPVDNLDLDFLPATSLHALIGLIFFAAYLYYFGPFFPTRALPPVPPASWCFFLYAGIHALASFISGFDPEIIDAELSLTPMKLAIFCWLAVDLLKRGPIAKRALLTFAIATAVLACGIVFELPGFSIKEGEAGRTTALGDNPNFTGGTMALSGIVLIGLLLNINFRRKIFLLLLGMTGVVLAAMISTGSRGSIVGFIAGSSIYLLPYWRSRRRLTAFVLAAGALVATVFMVLTNPSFLERWEETYYEGNMSGREDIFPAAFEMFLERPIFGWSPSQAGYELGRRTFVPAIRTFEPNRDAHNTVLALLIQIGIVGAVPYLIGVWLCGRTAWQARAGPLGLLPFAIVVSLIVTGMAGNSLGFKGQWLFLALAQAAPAAIVRKLPNSFLIWLARKRSEARTANQSSIRLNR